MLNLFLNRCFYLRLQSYGVFFWFAKDYAFFSLLYQQYLTYSQLSMLHDIKQPVSAASKKYGKPSGYGSPWHYYVHAHIISTTLNLYTKCKEYWHDKSDIVCHLATFHKHFVRIHMYQQDIQRHSILPRPPTESATSSKSRRLTDKTITRMQQNMYICIQTRTFFKHKATWVN